MKPTMPGMDTIMQAVDAADEVAVLKARIAELENALGQRADTLEAVFRLPPKLKQLFNLLLGRSVVTADDIHNDLNIETDAKVAVHRLRVHLEPWRFEIHSRRHVGYWFDDETKATIMGMITPTGNNVPAAAPDTDGDARHSDDGKPEDKTEEVEAA